MPRRKADSPPAPPAARRMKEFRIRRGATKADGYPIEFLTDHGWRVGRLGDSLASAQQECAKLARNGCRIHRNEFWPPKENT